MTIVIEEEEEEEERAEEDCFRFLPPFPLLVAVILTEGKNPG